LSNFGFDVSRIPAVIYKYVIHGMIIYCQAREKLGRLAEACSDLLRLLQLDSNPSSAHHRDAVALLATIRERQERQARGDRDWSTSLQQAATVWLTVVVVVFVVVVVVVVVHQIVTDESFLLSFCFINICGHVYLRHPPSLRQSTRSLTCNE
jgi:hypothetical protein